MTTLDKEILAERIAAIERHLNLVEKRLPNNEKDFFAGCDSSDSVILHLWQAIQIIIDIAMSSCVHLHLGSPPTYAEAFLKLGKNGYLDNELAVRLSHAAGFRNRIVHAYEDLDLEKVYKIAKNGPPDLTAFLKAVRQWVS